MKTCPALFTKNRRDVTRELPYFMHTRMAVKSSVLLLLLGTLVPQICSQHWSYGLSPGGKRELDDLSDTLDTIVERFQHVDTPCSSVGCAEESQLAKIYRIKGLLGAVTTRENGHRPFRK